MADKRLTFSVYLPSDWGVNSRCRSDATLSSFLFYWNAFSFWSALKGDNTELRSRFDSLVNLFIFRSWPFYKDEINPFNSSTVTFLGLWFSRTDRAALSLPAGVSLGLYYWLIRTFRISYFESLSSCFLSFCDFWDCRSKPFKLIFPSKSTEFVRFWTSRGLVTFGMVISSLSCDLAIRLVRIRICVGGPLPRMIYCTLGVKTDLLCCRFINLRRLFGFGVITDLRSFHGLEVRENAPLVGLSWPLSWGSVLDWPWTCRYCLVWPGVVGTLNYYYYY